MSAEEFVFSERTGWSTEINPLTRLRDELRQTGTRILDLTCSNPTQAGLIMDRDILCPFSEPECLVYRPDPLGDPAARASVRDYYKSHGQDIPVDRIVLTACTSDAYTYLFRLLADPDDTVLFPRPSYPLFSFLADLNDVNVRYYDLVHSETGWRVDPDNLASVWDDTVRAVVMVNPNNPAGSYIHPEDLRMLNHICRKSSAALISDEVFLDYVLREDFPKVTLTSNQEVLSFTMSGISKILGLPQMKLSWIVISGPEGDVTEAGRRLEVIADTYLAVNTPVQRALPEWMKRRQDFELPIQRRIQRNFGMLKEQLLESAQWEILEPQGGWYVILRSGTGVDEESFLLDLLREESVYLHPGFFFDLPVASAIVLSLLSPEADFDEGLRRLLRFSQSHIS